MMSEAAGEEGVLLGNKIPSAAPGFLRNSESDVSYYTLLFASGV